MTSKDKVHTRREKFRSSCTIRPTLLALAISQALTFQSAQAATIEVTSPLDDGTDCTLREALATVNAGSDQLNGCQPSGDVLGTNDTIIFGPGVSGQTITTTQGALPIAKDVSINPGGSNTTVVGNSASEVVNIQTPYYNPAANNGTAKINQLTISGGGSGISIDAYGNRNYNLILTNSTVTGNIRSGIGIGFGGSSAKLINSTVSGNGGNGIDVNYLSEVTLTNSTVSGNSGYGIRAGSYAGVVLTNSTVSGNTVGGIQLSISGLLMKNSTVTDNDGYGIIGDFDTNVTIFNSIISNSGIKSCALNNSGYNGSLNVGSDTISTTACGGATVADPLLGPLADNGGPTHTHALLARSPAIDNGTGTDATVSDQRGVAAEAVRDSGAYEFNAAANALSIEKLINNRSRKTPGASAQLLTGSLHRQVYSVTNNSQDRLYRVRVFENGKLVCNLYTLNPGETKQRCSTVEKVLEGDQHVKVAVNAKVSGKSTIVSANTDAYYTGISNSRGQLKVTHYIDKRNADTPAQAKTLSDESAKVLFKIENTGDIELYRVNTFHDPVSPVNSGWEQKCVIGNLKPGQVRYCKRDITLSEPGLNKAMGRAQGVDAYVSPTGVINDANPTYFKVRSD